MARLNTSVDDDSDGELPDLATILRGESSMSPSKTWQGVTEAAKVLIGKTPGRKAVAARSIEIPSRRTTSAFSNAERSRKQRPLGPSKFTEVNSMPLPLTKGSLNCVKKSSQDGDSEKRAQQVRSTPRRAANKPVDYSIFPARTADRWLSVSEDDDSFTDLSGFIVPDSASDEEDRPKLSKPKELQKPRGKSIRNDHTTHQIRTGNTTRQESPRKPFEIIDLSSPEKKPFKIPPPQSPQLAPSPSKSRHVSAGSSDLDEPFTQLRFSPPRSRKPSRTKNTERPITPPSNPSKLRFESPSKKRPIPPSPHRPSIDAFWSQDVINDWNDQYSPAKPPRTPGRDRLLALDEDDEEHISPSTSPRKSPIKSPTKNERQAVQAFNAKKANLATTFLAELDAKITNSQVASLATSTGGVTIIWSKKLSSTAGRANWRREAIRHRNSDGTTSETTYRHHASIELAEKVIDCEDRLINVLAHEYCHLANFMISGVKDQPHGKEFKTWAAKVTRAFSTRGVEVTTQHGYEISYKYIWTCKECDLEYKRHSKSIDPSKHSCGACKGRLVQILPVPRKENEYQRFVKANWERVKRSAGDEAGMGEINALLAKEWEAKKVKEGKGKGAVEVAVVEVAEDGKGGVREESPELDNVARKLDFLNLRA